MTSYPTTDAAMAEFWNELGQFWVDQQKRMDERMRPYSEALLRAAAPHPGEHALDIGCGCGETTFELAKAVAPAGSAVGIDVSRSMIAGARRRAAELGQQSNVSFMEADATRAPLPNEHFDLAISRFGTMFFEHPVRAFANIRQSLKTDGRLVFICWRKLDENPWMQNLNAAIAPFAPPPPPRNPEAPGPFSFGDPDRVGRILREAGFRDVALERFDCPMDMGVNVESATSEYAHSGSGAALLSTLDETARPRALDAVRSVMQAHMGADGVRMPSGAWIVSARGR